MAEVRKIGATDLSYKDYTSPAGKVVKGVEPVDVREFGAIPNAGAAVDQWSYFDTAIKYCNDNYKALYVPSGRYYVSAALDLSSNNTVRSFYTIKMFSDNWDHRDVGGSAVISPMSTFAGGTALVPTHLVIIDYGRGVIIDGISFRGNYASDSKYICAIGLKNYNSQTIINRVNIHDFYGGIHVAYGGDSNNDVNTFSNINIQAVDYGIINSGTQTFGTQIMNSGIVANKVCYDGTLIGTGEGSWAFNNVIFSFGTSSGPLSYGIKKGSGSGVLTIINCHFEPESQLYVPAFIYETGSASVGSMEIYGTNFNITGLGSADDGASYPAFTIGSPVAKFTNCLFSSNKNIRFALSNWSYLGRTIFDTCSFHFTGAGKTTVFTGTPVFMNTAYVQETDVVEYILNDGLIGSRQWTEYARIGFGIATTGWSAMDDPATLWPNGSIIFKGNTAAVGNSLQDGWRKIGGTLTPTYITTAPIMTTAPSASGDAGAAGSLAWDASYLYVCTGTNYWKRVALSAY